jgi:hypothetical protein
LVKFQAPLPNSQITVCIPRIATKQMIVLLIAEVKSINLRADCHRPELPAWFLLGLRAGVGNPQCI